MANIDVIVQARMGSYRLRGKVLKMISNKTMLEHVIDRLKLCKLVNNVIVATTTSKIDDKIEIICKERNFKYFRGDENNVLDRYYQTAKHFKCNNIIRITSDCPLIDPNIIDDMIKFYIEKNMSFLDMDYHNIDPGAKGGFPDGSNCQFFSFEKLEESKKNCNSDFGKEHVCIYLQKKYIKNEKYKIKVNENEYENLNFKKLHLSVDTIDDYNLIKYIIENINIKNFTIYDVLEYLNNNPYLLEIHNHYFKKKN